MRTVSRRGVLAALSSAGFLSALAAQDQHEPAPKFWAVTLDGETIDNETIKGKVILLQFWTTWCPYCRRDQPAVETIIEEFKDKDLEVVGVDVGEPKKKVQQYLNNSPRSCKIVLMEKTNLAALFPPKTYPLYVLIDRDGNIAGRQNGAGGEGLLRRLLAKAGLTAE
jgi:thiol-disulfide isomerase/thioredoxin